MTPARLHWMLVRLLPPVALAACMLSLLILQTEANGQKSAPKSGQNTQKSSQNNTEPTETQWNVYMKDVQAHVKKYWTPRVTYKRSHTVAAWDIHNDGTVSNIKIKDHGACSDDDLAAINAVKAASPFPPLPTGALEPCQIEFAFDSVRPKPLGLTVVQALKQFGPDAKKRLLAEFQSAGVAYPPKSVSVLSLKNERLLFIFARGKEGKWKQVAIHPIVACSGELGPKLKEGDMQVPEGFYNTSALDAGTHLCLWVDYPNREDRVNARAEHRTKLGGNIQIHEGVYSTGCVVLNHDDMADLFVLAHDVGINNVSLIIAPCNLLAKEPGIDLSKQPKWLPTLYKDLRKELASFPIDQTMQMQSKTTDSITLGYGCSRFFCNCSCNIPACCPRVEALMASLVVLKKCSISCRASA